MLFDVLTLAAVCDELRTKVLDGRVQKIVRLSEHAFGCEIYANHERHWLLISAHPQNARVHLVPEKLARGSDDVTPLLLLLRKHVSGGRLIEIAQAHLERVLVLTFQRRELDSESIQQTELIIEVMGRHSNIILAGYAHRGEGDAPRIVLDSLKRVSAQLSRQRVILPHHPYSLPPSQSKTPPDALTSEAMERAIASTPAEMPLWQLLVGAVAGMSPLLAREVAFRVSGDALAQCRGVAGKGERVVNVLLALYGSLRDREWSPTVVRRGSDVVAFAPYRLEHLGNAEPYPSISQAVTLYYQSLEQLSPVAVERDRVQARLGELRDRHARRKAALERSLRQGEQADRLRASGETILSAIGCIAPKQNVLEQDGISIKLNPELSAVENAQAYFQEYRKAKAALKQVPELIAEEDAVLAYLAQVDTQLDLAQSVYDVRRVALDMKVAGLSAQPAADVKEKERAKKRQQTKAKRPTSPMPFRVVAGHDVYVGRSASENEAVTFAVARPDDLWLHARGVPGAHVVVKCGGRLPSDEVILEAARLAAGFSRAKGNRQVAVDCTLRKHVRKVRAGLPGLVTYSDERTIDVRLEGVNKSAT